MVRSPGFGSSSSDNTPYSDSVSLRLPMLLVNLPLKLTRRLILQQAYHHTINSALIACTHTVSYSISLPARGSFHLSITVLVHYRLLTVFSLSKMVLLDSHRISRARCYSGANRVNFIFDYRAITVSGCAFQHYSSNKIKSHVMVLQPHHKWFGLLPVRSPLLRESLICFIFFWLLRCFSSPAYLYLPYVFR